MARDQSHDKIDVLIGEPLSGVAFVQDYVEFHFDGRILRALTFPSISIAGESHEFPQVGSRDAMCCLIGRVVEEVAVEENKEIAIHLSGGALVSVPLGRAQRHGPEAAHFVPGMNLPIEVW